MLHACKHYPDNVGFFTFSTGLNICKVADAADAAEQLTLPTSSSSGSVVDARARHRGAHSRRLHLQVRHLAARRAHLPADDGHEGAPGRPRQERGGLRTRRYDLRGREGERRSLGTSEVAGHPLSTGLLVF